MLSRPIRPLAAALPRAWLRCVSSRSSGGLSADGGLVASPSLPSRRLPQAAAAPSAQPSAPPRARTPRRAVPIQQLELADDPHANWTLGQADTHSRDEHAESPPASFAELCVHDVLASKASAYGSQIHTVSPDESLGAALQTMSFFNVGALLVMEGGQLAGVLSTRDLLKRIDDEWRAVDPKSTKVRDIMTQAPSVVYVEADTPVLRCMRLMSEGGFRHLPVMQDGRVSGVLSIGDCVRALMTQYQDKSDFLEDMVKGKYPA